MPSAGDSVADTSKAVIFPVNGPTIGHIVDGAYVPIAPDAIPSIPYSDVAMKDWAGYWLKGASPTCCRAGGRVFP